MSLKQVKHVPLWIKTTFTKTPTTRKHKIKKIFHENPWALSGSPRLSFSGSLLGGHPPPSNRESKIWADISIFKCSLGLNYINSATRSKFHIHILIKIWSAGLIQYLFCFILFKLPLAKGWAIKQTNTNS